MSVIKNGECPGCGATLWGDFENMVGWCERCIEEGKDCPIGGELDG